MNEIHMKKSDIVLSEGYKIRRFCSHDDGTVTFHLTYDTKIFGYVGWHGESYGVYCNHDDYSGSRIKLWGSKPNVQKIVDILIAQHKMIGTIRTGYNWYIAPSSPLMAEFKLAYISGFDRILVATITKQLATGKWKATCHDDYTESFNCDFMKDAVKTIVASVEKLRAELQRNKRSG